MTRDDFDTLYDRPGKLSGADAPDEGYYAVRIVKGGPRVACKIWFGCPLDPLTGEELDRSPRWCALRNGAEVHVFEIWPYCAREPITEAEYNHLLAVYDWAFKNGANDPAANPDKPIDLNKTNLLF